MSTFDLLRNLTSKLERATQSVHAEIADLRKRIADTRAKLDAATSAPLPPADVLSRITAYVRDEGARYLEPWGSAFVHGDHAFATPNPDGVRPPWDRDIPFGALCAGAPELAITILQNLIEAVPHEAGAPLKDRPSLIARLQLELTELETAEEHAIDAAAANGVVIAHRAEVTQRRANAARARQLEAERLAAREERQTRVEQDYAPGRSRYLAANAVRGE
jgi:hypothetical protein